MDFREFQERLQGMEYKRFERFAADVVRDSGLFTDIQTNVVLDDREVDIIASEIRAGGGPPVRVFFEVKTGKIVSREAIYQAGRFLFRDQARNRAILIAAAPLTDSALHAAADHGVEIWDSMTLAAMAKPSTIVAHFGVALVNAPASPHTNKEHAYSTALRAVAAGKDDAMDYQHLIAQIFEVLFCPPLERPRFELNDEARRNRRDMIFENAAPAGFWAHARMHYQADYLVVDAKNYREPIGKNEVLEIAHYLKKYGCGLFGILVTRAGASDAALHAIREHWIGASKMIVVLNDDHMHEMLRVHGQAGRPEEIIRDRIAEFRMKL